MMAHCTVSAGSSPHTRGAPNAPNSSSVNARDHPRIRGEHRFAYMGIKGRHGIIPAYAGSTALIVRQGGECEGSSPHTRGAPLT